MQSTRVSSSFPTAENCANAVIQGSVIGLLLFVLYINDVDDLFGGGVVSTVYAGGGVVSTVYADDVKIF